MKGYEYILVSGCESVV